MTKKPKPQTPDILRTDTQAQHEAVSATRSAEELLFDLRLHQVELEMQNEELQQAHLTLEASRDRYLQLYDFAPVAYLTLSEHGFITEANLTASTLFGLERNALINRRFASLIAPEDGDRWHRHFIHAQQDDENQTIELTLRRSDDTRFNAHLVCLFEEKQDVAMLRIAITDISERKQTEESLRIAAAAFETHEGIIVTDAHTHILRANQAFTRITGYSLAQITGLTPSFLRSGLHTEEFYRCLWTSLISDGYWQGEIWDKHKNGTVFPLWLTISAVADTNGNITHFVGSFTDITVQKQAEKVLLDARRNLENQVSTSQAELEIIKKESQEINTALNVLLKHREMDKSDAQSMLFRLADETVLPFIKQLKKTAADSNQICLLNTLETNLLHLIKTYGCADSLSYSYQRLTPVEIQVATMVKQGLSTKHIAKSLQISPGTVGIHRKHIRKKLGLNSKAANLSSYLMSLSDNEKPQ